MEIHLKNGIDKLVFGMKQPDVIALYGKPDNIVNDEEQNVVFAYNALKTRLTFYDDEDMKLGYIISSNPNLQLFGKKIIGEKPEAALAFLEEQGIKNFESENIDIDTQYFEESNWLMLISEYAVITKVELGAIINDKDEFDWKFKK